MKNTKLVIPNRFLSVDYDQDVLQSIKDLVDNFKTSRKGLYLFGNVGTGKTHTAYAICKKIEESGIKVRAFKAIEILNMIKEDMNIETESGFFEYNGDKFFDSDSEHITFLKGINEYKGFLFIDDFGTEKGTEWVLETFYSIIDKKYEDLIPIIITSNSSLNELGVKMGDRIASRIAQMCDVIEMTGLDKRLNQMI